MLLAICRLLFAPCYRVFERAKKKQIANRKKPAAKNQKP